jgi:cell division protein FtsN
LPDKQEKIEIMKRIIFVLVVGSLAFSACKSKKELAQSPYTVDPAAQPKVFTVPAQETQPKPQQVVKEEPVVTPSEPVAMRKEQVSFTRQEDKDQNETNNFFVILGSFSQLDNAKNYRETLLNKGFTPIILHSETGYYRVCVNSYQNEGDARTRVAQIRQTYPEHSDVWLLIKD